MTNATLILRDRNTIDGYVQPIVTGGTINFPFSVTVASVTIHNVSDDFIEVIPTTLPISTGNGILVIAPNSSQSISNTPEVSFQSVLVNNLNLTGKGNGWVIVNGFYS